MRKRGWLLICVTLGFFAFTSILIYLSLPNLNIYKFEHSIKNQVFDEYCLVHSYTPGAGSGQIVLEDGRSLVINAQSLPSPDDGLYLGLLIQKDKVIDLLELPRTYSEALIVQNNSACKKLKD